MAKWYPDQPKYKELEERLIKPDPALLEQILAEKDHAVAFAHQSLQDGRTHSGFTIERAQPRATRSPAHRRQPPRIGQGDSGLHHRHAPQARGTAVAEKPRSQGLGRAANRRVELLRQQSRPGAGLPRTTAAVSAARRRRKRKSEP
jgi:hypothetical protein